MEITVTTKRGKHYGRVSAGDHVVFVSSGYITERMAHAAAGCWAAFHADESPAVAYERMVADVDAPAVETPVENLRRDDYVLHTFTMKAAYNRKGQRVSDEYRVTKWVQTSGSWRRYEGRGASPDVYGYRLNGFQYGEYADKGAAVKVLANPEALEAAHRAHVKAIYARLPR